MPLAHLWSHHCRPEHLRHIRGLSFSFQITLHVTRITSLGHPRDVLVVTLLVSTFPFMGIKEGSSQLVTSRRGRNVGNRSLCELGVTSSVFGIRILGPS